MTAHRVTAGEPSGPSLLAKSVTAFIVSAGFLSVVLALWWFRTDRAVVTAAIICFILTALRINAITVAFHRAFTHGALKLRPFWEWYFSIVGSTACEGPPSKWVPTHRKHHRFADDVEDPHSPHHYGDTPWEIVRGFIHAHVGWVFTAKEVDCSKYAPDILSNRRLVVVSKLFPLWAVLGFIVPGLLEALFVPTPKGFFMGVLWGGFVSVFLVHHLTWSINSVCHLWGTRPFQARDHSANVFPLGVLAFGEGFHRNHHAFPWSAKIGLRWWEFDLGWATVRFLEFIRGAYDVKYPSRSQIQAKKIV